MSSPLRIAMFVGTFPVISETFIVNQITGMLKRGHEVDIYAELRAEKNAPVQPDVSRCGLLDRTTFMDMPPEVHPWELPIWPITEKTWVPGAINPVSNMRRLVAAAPVLATSFLRAPALALEACSKKRNGYLAESLSSVYRLAKLSSVSTPGAYDVLHAHFGPVANRFLFSRKLWKRPLLASFYGYDFAVIPQREGNQVYTRLFQECDRVVVISSYIGKRLEALGCPGQKIRKIPLGVRLADFPFAERSLRDDEPVRLLTVARLVEKKGVEFCIQALAKLAKSLRRFEYRVIGDGPLRRNIESLIADLGLGEVVRLDGARDLAYVRQQMAQAHIFILPSVTAMDGDQEGQGLVLQEAQACGLPVITTTHTALPEGIAEGKSGFLVRERDVEALAEKILHLARHPEIWPEMGRAGRTFVEANFDLDVVNEKLEHLYIELRSESGR